MKTLGAIAVIVAASAMIPGCGGLIKDYCAEVCSCEDCSDIGNEECEIKLNASEEVASVYGCDETWEARRECEIERYTCVGGAFMVVINDVNPCQTEYDALNRCIDDGSGTR